MTEGRVLEVRDLSVSYGKVEALHDVSLTIRRGEIVTVIGPTPPGTGVIQPATSCTLLKSTSPTTFVERVPSGRVTST